MHGWAPSSFAESGARGLVARLHNVSYATSLNSRTGPFRPHRIKAGLLASLLAVRLAAPPAAAASTPPIWGVLDNGLQYVLLENHAAPLVGSSVIVHAGSAREDFLTSGASHFLEHLLFNGTLTRTQEQLYDDVDAIGGYNNATTRKTHVAYMMLTPSERIREGLEIQCDMLFHSTLPPEKLEKERGIILEELAKDRDQGSFEAERALELAAFGAQGIGLPTLGSEVSIRTMPRERILDFYTRLYVPQNMTLLVVGDFLPGEMEHQVQETFGAQPPRDSMPPLPIDEPIWDGEARILTAKGESLVLEWTSPGPDPRDRRFLALECLVELLAGTEAAPLNQALRARFPQVLSAGGRVEMIPGHSFLRYRVEADSTADWRAIVAAFPEIVRGQLPRFQAEDVEAWKVARETEEFYLQEKPHYYPIYRGERVAAQGAQGILDLPSRIRALSPSHLTNLTLGWETGRCRIAVVLPSQGASRAERPSQAQAAPQVERTELPNGVDVLVASSPESPVLALHVFVRGRSEAEPPGMDGAVELLHRLIATRTARSDPQVLERRLRSIGAELKTADQPEIPYDDFYSTSEYSYIRLQSLDRYADEAFSLLGELLGPPGWRDADFETERQAMIARAERAASGSLAVGRRLVRENLFPATPRAREIFGSPTTLAAVDPGSLRQLSARYFVGQRIVLSVATGLPASEILRMAERALGGLPGGSGPAGGAPTGSSLLASLRLALSSPATSASKLDIAPPESTVVRLQDVGAQQARVVWARPLGSIDPSALPAAEVWNGVLSNSMQFQLREREGLAYALGSSIERLSDGTLLWVASAGTRKENVPRMVAGFQEQLTSALEAVPDSATVERQGAQLYGRALMRRATRMNRAYAAGLAWIEGRDPEAVDEEIRASMKVTPGQITEMLGPIRRDSPSLLVIVY